jgi:small subunit ribosomal protein S1
MIADNDSFEELLQASEKKPIRSLSPGQKTMATIVGIDGETIFLDVGLKSEGIINAAEFLDEHGELGVKIGDSVSVYYLKSGRSEQLFTTRLGSGAGSAHLEEAWRSGVPVEGTVKAEIKGGFEVTLSGNVRAFCPYSQMGLRRVDDPAGEYIDSRKTFRITQYSENGRNIVISARVLQEEEQQQKKEELQATLTEGTNVSGTVSSIRPFGLFVDIGGIDGLVPLSEVGWSRVENLEEQFYTGQQVQVVIKSLDWENERISLSIKETLEDPWEAAINSFPEGTSHVGFINRLAPFGAFVNLAPGIDGLVHISKLGQGRRLNHPREAVEEGQQIEVLIESIDLANKRISLAPSDYESAEDKADKERKDFSSYLGSKENTGDVKGSLGTLGALLKKKLEEKKKG